MYTWTHYVLRYPRDRRLSGLNEKNRFIMFILQNRLIPKYIILFHCNDQRRRPLFFGYRIDEAEGKWNIICVPWTLAGVTQETTHVPTRRPATPMPQCTRSNNIILSIVSKMLNNGWQAYIYVVKITVMTTYDNTRLILYC